MLKLAVRYGFVLLMNHSGDVGKVYSTVGPASDNKLVPVIEFKVRKETKASDLLDKVRVQEEKLLQEIIHVDSSRATIVYQRSIRVTCTDGLPKKTRQSPMREV